MTVTSAAGPPPPSAGFPPAAGPCSPEVDHPRPRPARRGRIRGSDGVFRSARTASSGDPESDGSSCEVVPQSPRKGEQYAAELLTPAEVTAIISRCSLKSRTGTRDRALLTLLYRSGLRIEEALAIRVADLNMTNHTIRLLETKSQEAQTRGYHADADDALLRWLELRRAIGRGGPLFCTLKGGPIWEQQVRNKLKRLAAAAGIEKRVHPHGFRHTFAAELRREGTDIAVISALLGHKSLVHTERYLRDLTNDQAVNALQGVHLPKLGA